jgi:hypothetical protein
LVAFVLPVWSKGDHVLTVTLAAFGAGLGAALGAGLELARRNAREMPRFAVLVTGILLFGTTVLAIDGHIRRSRDISFLAEIDSTRGVVAGVHPEDHDRLTVDYIVNGVAHRRREQAPSLARDFAVGDSVVVYFRQSDPIQGRYVRPTSAQTPFGAFVAFWALGYAGLLGVGASFAKAWRPEVAQREGAA